MPTPQNGSSNPQDASHKISFLLSSIILGFTCMTSQIVLFREMMVTFYGNELSFGVMLFVWLFWEGVGAFWGNKVAKSNPRKLSFCYLAISILALLTIIAVRHSKLILGAAPAEIVGFLPMVLFSFLGMSIFCFLLGLTFVLNSKSWAFDQSLVFLVNRVYLWESLGTGLGGFVATFIFVPNLSNFQIIVLVFSLNLLLSAFLLTKGLRNISKVIIWTLTFLVIINFKGLKLDEKLDSFSLNTIWRGLPLIHSEDTKYGNIAVVKKNEQITFYENGLMLFSYPDEYSSEEAVHFALLEHPNPKRLLLIGGGLGGAITQALKYKDLKIDFVELDPKLIKIGETYLPENEIRSLENPLVKMYFQDGRLFVKERLSEIGSIGEKKVKPSQSPSQSPSQYDVIILNLPDPHTAQLGRFFTFEFFRMIKSILKEDGIFSFRVSSAENYISQELGLYLSSLYRTLKLNFAEVIVLPGSNNVFLASNRKGILFESWQELVERLKERKISTKFVNEHFLPDRLSSMRVEYLKNAIYGERLVLSEVEGSRTITSETSRINYDLKPISYFYNTILWSKQFKSVEKPVFLFLSKIKPFWFICVIALIFIVGFSACFISRSRLSNLALSAIFMAGFTSIFLEIIIVLSFQIFYGYIYSKIGLILTLFMLGLAFGAFLIQKRTSQKRINFKNLTLIQFFQVILVSFLLFLVLYFYKISPPEFLVECLLLLVITLSGIIGGMEFTLANHLFIEKKTTTKAGTGYSVDLFGSSLSSILASAILIPLLGIPTTLILILVTNFICLSFLFAYQKLA
jgi:spermidine synthase